MATPEEKHSCFLLNFFKGPADTSSAPESGSADLPDEASVSVDSGQGQADISNDVSGDAGSGLQLGEEQLNAGLEAVQADPLAFMGKLPAKYDAQGELLSSGKSLFDEEAIREKSFVDARDGKRQELTELDVVAAGRVAFAKNDQADDFVDSFLYSGLQGMEENGLMSARLEESPWSDDYWAIYLGMLGHRYAEPRFPGAWDWKANFDYIQKNPALQIVESGDSDAVNRLSPSEKYDILVGDKGMTLTSRMWDEGKKYYSRNGKVEPWMGLCHGWAPASYMLPRPTAPATVLAADGKTFIVFYPSDIKALATLLWAKVKTDSRFVGGRCNEKNPTVDPQSGRILAGKCFDTNPGTWHLAVVNQIGASQRSMVLDATYDYEVWNQPVVGYAYRYFNPQKMRYAHSLFEASVLKTSFDNDRFGQYRDRETETIIGIAMDISYTVETAPEHRSSDSAQYDRVQTVRYYYDLELDALGNIIGGEWYQNAHPDFLWTPEKGSRAVAYWEKRYGVAGSWKSEEPLAKEWCQVAAMTSGYQHAPLAVIVEQLIRFSNS
ncbi:MAG: hypothetical protein WGN25_00100 [Candidatus Electrothrix sp. GW3-4]|uniref:hypothetical protein n=1 Tax=Candidatus Electrothrix sp. GW3-4 TaxID=3126740 RepID=UPI0030D056A3